MKSSYDLSLYLVANRGTLDFEDFFRLIRQSIEGGVTIVQLRDKMASDDEMIAMGKKLHSFLKPLGIPLLINDRVNIARLIDAEGVHLGQSDLKVADARSILGKEAIIGLSVETIEQLLAAAREEVDYIAASPVFLTQTKPDCTKQWGLEGLKQVCSLSPHPVIGIGGIDETNVEEILACGAAGVAVVSALFNAPCPKTAAARIRARLKTSK